MRQQISLQADEFGQLRGVRYHDGCMKQFCFNERLTFVVQALDESLTELVLQRVRILCTDPLWESAIVTNIDVWKAQEAPAHLWSNLLQGRVSPMGIEADIARILPQYSDSWLVEVGTAYGGGFTCLCEEVEVYQTLP